MNSYPFIALEKAPKNQPKFFYIKISLYVTSQRHLLEVGEERGGQRPPQLGQKDSPSPLQKQDGG